MRRVVLVGFMAAGKSTVGREVARRLGWRFLDLDAEIERRTGRSVPEIFADPGEAFFREVEERLARELLAGHEVVLASGGGWGAVPGRLDGLGPETLTVWLRVEPSVVLERARAQDVVRPLLVGPDPEEAVRALLAEREPLYARSRLHLDTTGASPEALAGAIVQAVRQPHDRS